MTNHRYMKDLCADLDVSAESAEAMSNHVFQCPDVHEIWDEDMRTEWEPEQISPVGF